MSTQDTRLDVIKQDISLPGCRLTATGLAIPKPDAATFKRVGRYLQTVDACRAWWWGDYLNAYCAWKLAEAKKAKAGETLKEKEERKRLMEQPVEQSYVHYTTEFADIAGVEEATLRDWLMIARFYEVGCRQPTLSWSHHWEAWAGAEGKLAAALGWLKDASAYCWSKTELRAHIREASPNGGGGQAPAPLFKVQELIAFGRWARGMSKQLSVLKPADARALRDDLEPAVELARALDARLGITGPSGKR
jgi:hypothetical protein